MNTKRSLTAVVTAILASAAFAEAEEAASSRWSLSVGPAWRSSVRMETSGRISVPAPTPNGQNLFRSEIAPVPDPMAGQGGIPEDGLLWGYSDTYAVLNGGAWSDYRVNDSDTSAPMGLNLAACYDFHKTETLAVGLNFRFAGYWNMKRSTVAGYNVWRNDYVYPTGIPPEDMSDRNWQDSVDRTIDIESLYNTALVGSGVATTRLRSDLYQLGLGPRVAWSPFVGRCDCMDWLDVYGGVEVLLNIAHTSFAVDGYSSSDTPCMIGFGGNLGLVGNVTDWLGVYGQVGYEWVDRTDVSAGNFRADVDYSSLVLSAGLQFRF